MARVPASVQDLPTGAEKIDVSDLGRLPPPDSIVPAAPPADPPRAGLSLADLAVPGVSKTVPGTDPLGGLVEPRGSSSGQVSQAGQSATRAMVQASPVIPGAIAGGKVGASLGAFAGPPGAIAGGLLGTVAGGLAGVMAGAELADLGAFLFPDVVSPAAEDVPEERRVAAVVGEAFGGSILMGGQVLAVARSGATLGSGTLVNRLINQVLSSARTSPGVFATAETAGAFGAAVGAGAAEAVFPGDIGARTSGEVIGGFFAPMRTLTTGAEAIVARGRNGALALANALPEGVARRVPGATLAQQQRAKQVLLAYLQETGTDIGALRRAIREQDIADLPLSVGQKTGDPALLALEIEFARTDETFHKALERGGKEALSTVRDLIVMMRGTGDPQLVRQAAAMRDEALTMGLSARIDAARENAIRAAGNISADTPEAREALSTKLFEAMEAALKDARAVEKGLWQSIPKNLLVDDAPLREAFDFLQPRLAGQAFDLPPEIRQFVALNLDELAEGAESSVVTVERVLEFRSTMLDAARNAASGATPDRRAVRAYEAMADAALRALDDPSVSSVLVPTAGQRGLTALELATRQTEPAPAGVKDAIDSARAYSRALNDTFSRTFVGSSLQKTAGGGYRRAPESMLRHALATGQDATNRNMREISEAMDFVMSRGELVSAREAGTPRIRSEAELMADVTLVQDAQERALRLAAAEAVDPTTGLPSARRLEGFKQKYQSTLSRFPEVVEAIDGAIASNDKLLRLTGQVKKAEKLASRGVLRKLTGSENPTEAIRTVLNGDFPQEHIRQLAVFARKVGPDEVEGLTSALFEVAVARATNSSSGVVDLTRLHTALSEPLRPGQPAILDMMQSNGLGTPEWHTTVRKFLGRAAQIDAAMKQSVAAADVLQDPDFTTELFLSIAGSGLGGYLSRLGGGSTSLIAQGRGAAYMRNTFSRLPMGRTRAFLTQVLRDPKKMDALLDVPDSQQGVVDLVRQVHGYILQAGLPPGDGVQEERETENPR